MKKEIYRELKDGIINLVIGTHAIIQDPVIFKKLGLVIIDEQHRFGVDQRKQLLNKGKWWIYWQCLPRQFRELWLLVFMVKIAFLKFIRCHLEEKSYILLDHIGQFKKIIDAHE